MKKLIILSLLIACLLNTLRSQDVPVATPSDTVSVQEPPVVAPPDTVTAKAVRADTPSDTVKNFYNLIKFNITSALLKNFSLQYERVLSRGVSVALTFRMMQESGIPYSDNIIRWFDITDPDAQDIIKNSLIGNFTITPEIRFYTGKKKYGNGFYFALFYRYGQYTLNNALIPYDTDAGDQVTLTTSGNVSSHSGGFMLGAQWTLGKRMCLDWWILGPHYGVSSGDMTSLSSAPLSEVDQQDIADELNGIDIPMFSQTVSVTADKVSMIFDGPWAGIRAGLSIGVKF
jgi:hypothetical protein